MITRATCCRPPPPPGFLAPVGSKRLAGMEQVPRRRVAAEQRREPGADGVEPCRQPAHERRREARVVLSHVQVAVAVELHGAAGSGHRIGRELVVMNGARRRHVEDPPSGVAEPLAEVRLVRVHEELGVEVADLGRRVAAHQHRGRLHPADGARRGAAALHGDPPVQEQRAGERRADPGQSPRARLRRPVRAQELGAGGAAPGSSSSAASSAAVAPGWSSESSFSSRQ